MRNVGYVLIMMNTQARRRLVPNWVGASDDVRRVPVHTLATHVQCGRHHMLTYGQQLCSSLKPGWHRSTSSGDVGTSSEAVLLRENAARSLNGAAWAHRLCTECLEHPTSAACSCTRGNLPLEQRHREAGY